MDVVHYYSLYLASSLYLPQVYVLSQHYYQQVRVLNILMCLSLNPVDEFLKFGEVVCYQ